MIHVQNYVRGTEHAIVYADACVCLSLCQLSARVYARRERPPEIHPPANPPQHASGTRLFFFLSPFFSFSFFSPPSLLHI